MLKYATLHKNAEYDTTLAFQVKGKSDERTAQKILAEDGRCDVIATGSLLGIKYKYRKRRERMEPSSIPVGYERQATMYSLSFDRTLMISIVMQSRLTFRRSKGVFAPFRAYLPRRIESSSMVRLRRAEQRESIAIAREVCAER